MKWHLTKDELPEKNEYVLCYVPGRPWSSNADNDTHHYVVAKLIKGISKKEREALPDDDPRKRRFTTGDEWSNNLVPYEWYPFGPGSYFGQEVIAWAYIDLCDLDIPEEAKYKPFWKED